jgi:hypothetical protein
MRIMTGAALAGVALLVPACGAMHKEHAQTPQDYYQQAVAYAKCMRTHGVAGFPDPSPQGDFLNVVDRTTPAFTKAKDACKKLAPGPQPAADLQQTYQRLMKFAACMRSHGLSNFPNPTLANGGVGIGDGQTAAPGYPAAHAACRSLDPAAGNP